MAITKAEVLAVVNKRMGRAETDIDDEILAALYDISTRGDFLLTTSNQNTADGDVDYSQPTGLKHLLTIYLSAGKNGKRTEALTKISWAEYLWNRGGETTADEDEPDRYTFHRKTIFPYPVPDATYEMVMDYAIYHANDVDNISFDESFREAIYEMTIVKVCESFQLWDDAKAHMTLFGDEIAKVSDQEEKPPSGVRHRDI